MGLKSNDTDGRIIHRTGQGFARDVPAKHKHGTPEEIGARVGGTFTTLPDNKPSNFRQLGPSSQGGNVNDLKARGYKGDQKFGNPRRYA